MRPGDFFSVLVRRFLRRTKKFKITEVIPLINYCKNCLRFKAVAHPRKIIWVKPKDINLWLVNDMTKRKKHGAGEILDGDWDLDTVTFERSDKYVLQPLYQSIIAHFKDGIPWEKTSLFQIFFLKRMREKGVVRGVKNMQELVNMYNDKTDSLHDSVKKEGVLLPSKDRRPKIDFLYVHIGRRGEMIWTSGGNHRLLIAKYLNIDYIPVRVWWRHKNWQEIRDKLSRSSEQERQNWDAFYLKHPDLEDIFRSEGF